MSNTQSHLISPTIASALAGGMFVGLSASIIALMALGPLTGYLFGAAETVMVGFLGMIFGTVAGAVAGASETRDEVPVVVSAPKVKARPLVAQSNPAV